MSTLETLASLPLDKRRGRNCQLKIVRVTSPKGQTITVGLFSVNEAGVVDELGIVIGAGPTRRAALSDAQDTLQAALDSVDVTILKGNAES